MNPNGRAAAITPSAEGLPAVQPQNLRDLPDLRARVVREAESWIGTPFHHAARVKGAGVDCLMLLAEVYERAGIAPHIEPSFYVPDWHLHRDAERYLEGLVRYAREIADPPEGTEPLPGDIALFRFGRTFSHGAIVTAWPRLIHAYWSIGVVRGDATLNPLARRPVRFFSPFERCPSPRPSPRKRGEGELTAAGVHPSEPW